ncbi:MAG: MFS transporter [Halanaerobiales bacterium]|nr:MFS transporter [Halanaerobiales bacterium]
MSLNANVTGGLEQQVDKKMEFKIRKNMLLMVCGKLVSQFGSIIYGFALGLYVLKATGSGLGFAGTLVCSLLPGIILGPFAGVIADRFNRKRMVVIMDFLSGLVVFGLYVLTVKYGLKLPYIYTASILLSICSTFFNVSLDSSIPNIVDDKRLMRMNSLNQSVSSITQITGPMLGGLVYGLVDVKVFLLVNALSFIISAFSELFIDFRLTAKSIIKVDGNLTVKKVFSEMKDGVLYMKSDEAMWMVMIFALFINFFTNIAFGIPLPYIINEVLHFSPWQYGCITSAYPIGILVGALLLSVLPEFKKKFKVMLVCLLITSTCVFCIGIPGVPMLDFLGKLPFFIFYIVVILIMGANSSIFNIPLFTLLQRTVPDEYRGRVFGIIQTFIMALTPVSFILAGYLIDRVPAYSIPIAAGIMLFIFVIKSFASNESLKKI